MSDIPELLPRFLRERDAVITALQKLKPEASCDGFGKALVSMLSLRQVLQSIMDRRRRASAPSTSSRRHRHKAMKPKAKPKSSVFVVNTGQTRKHGSRRGPP